MSFSGGNSEDVYEYYGAYTNPDVLKVNGARQTSKIQRKRKKGYATFDFTIWINNDYFSYIINGSLNRYYIWANEL